MSNNVRTNKLRLGLCYGIMAGLSFAVSAWGVDAWLLARANIVYFWVKFLPGAVISILAAGTVGWLTVRFNKHSYAIVMWGLLALLYSWLVVWLPFEGASKLIGLLDPGVSRWFNFSPVDGLNQFRLFSVLIIGVIGVIAGLLEINLVDQAVLSPYIYGNISALVICLVLFAVAGSASDNLINSNLREPVQAVDKLLRFARQNAGTEVPEATARAMHLSSVRQLGDLVRQPHKMDLIGYDSSLGIISLLVDFSGSIAKCSAVYSQPTDCVILSTNP